MLQVKVYKNVVLAQWENFLIRCAFDLPLPSPSSVDKQFWTNFLKFSFPLFWARLALQYTLLACPHAYSMPSPTNLGWLLVDQSTSTQSCSPRYIKQVFSLKKSKQSSRTEEYSTFSSTFSPFLLTFVMYDTLGLNNPCSQRTCQSPFSFPTHPSLISSSSTWIGMLFAHAISCTSFMLLPFVLIRVLPRSSLMSFFNWSLISNHLIIPLQLS